MKLTMTSTLLLCLLSLAAGEQLGEQKKQQQFTDQLMDTAHNTAAEVFNKQLAAQLATASGYRVVVQRDRQSGDMVTYVKPYTLSHVETRDKTPQVSLEQHEMVCYSAAVDSDLTRAALAAYKETYGDKPPTPKQPVTPSSL